MTIRDRDTMSQERVPVEGVKRLILDRMEARPAVTRRAGPPAGLPSGHPRAEAR